METVDFTNYDSMNLSQLADSREFGLERVHKVTEAMKRQVRQEYAAGTNIKRLARSAKVTRRTIYKWLEE